MIKLFHCTAYAGLSGAYAANYLGFDKDIVSIAAALVYLILAVDALMSK